MKERDLGLHPLFPGLETPEPDPRLRSRVLHAARRAAAEGRLKPWQRWVDRLWANPALHVAWLAAMLALLVVNAVAVGVGGISAASPRRLRSIELSEQTTDGELSSDIRHALVREGV